MKYKQAPGAMLYVRCNARRLQMLTSPSIMKRIRLWDAEDNEAERDPRQAVVHVATALDASDDGDRYRQQQQQQGHRHQR